MTQQLTAVFFYGLFMDQSLLASKGFRPATARVGCLEGYRLQIGRRAALLREHDSKVYGVLMTMQADHLSELYSEKIVADYVPEEVTVELPGGAMEPAICYNLPADKLEGRNPDYANALLILADNLGLPAAYLQHIKEQAG